MVSRSNYVAITLIMCVILLMFQLTGVSENVLLNTGENKYSEEAISSQLMAEEKNKFDELSNSLEFISGGNLDVGLVGKEDDYCLVVGKQWCITQKKKYCYYSCLEDAVEDIDGAQFLIINGKEIKTDEDAEAIQELSKQGRNIVVSQIPDIAILKENKNVLNAIGIQKVRAEEVKVDGFKLFAGLILGGETVYKDYEQKMPFVQLDHSVTAYAVAQSKDKWLQELENEELPAIIWRYSPNEGKIYVVNGDYLEDCVGAGLLTGFMADSSSTYLYPVVNAQVSVVENYPVISDENEKIMEDEYGQKSSIVFRDILWPSIVAIFYDTDDKMTVTSALRLNYEQQEDLDESLLQYYYEQITKESGEIGISGYQVSNIALEEKIEQDLELYEKVLPNYEIRVFQAGKLKEQEYSSLVGTGNLLEDVKTILVDYSENLRGGFFSYLDDEILQIPLYMDSTVMNDEDDFRSRCLQTAYGYYGTSVDVADVIYPQSDDDSWNIISNEWSKNYRPYRVLFEKFEKLTATESDQRVRNYLALEYEMKKTEDKINITVDSSDEESYFVLRLHGEDISEMSGGTYEEIEDGWYLLTIIEDSVNISLQQTYSVGYYIE